MKIKIYLLLVVFGVLACSKKNFPGEIGVWVLSDITSDNQETSFLLDLDDYKNTSWVEFLDVKAEIEGEKKLKLNDGLRLSSNVFVPSGELNDNSNLSWKRDGSKIYIKEKKDNNYVNIGTLFIVEDELRIEKNVNGDYKVWYWLRKK